MIRPLATQIQVITHTPVPIPTLSPREMPKDEQPWSQRAPYPHRTSSSPEFLRTSSAPFQRLSSNKFTLENSGAVFTQRWLRGSAQRSSSCSKAARVTRKRWLQGRNSPPALTRTKSAGLGRRHSPGQLTFS